MKTQNALFRFAKRHLIPSLVLAGTLIDPAPVRAQTLTLAATNLFGGAGDQRATAVSIAGGALYFSGVSAANSGDGLVGRYALPTVNNAAPVWSTLWPALTDGDDFQGVAASSEGVYLAGSSVQRTSDTVGGKEQKAITVKFPLTGATGGGFGGSIWDRQTPAAPGAFAYGGFEYFFASLVTVESGNTFVYATGAGQINGVTRRLFVSKLDTNGVVLWTRDDSATTVGSYSDGRGLAALNGNIYVAGRNDGAGANQGHLRKYDASGNLIWSRSAAAGSYMGVTALGASIFTVGQAGSGASANFLVEKWDEAGNRAWSQQYDRNSAEDILTGVVALNGRIYAVGSTRGTTAGGADAALLDIDPASGNLLSTTLYGGAQDDIANGIATDGASLYVVGETRSFVAGGNIAGQNDAFVLRYAVAPSLVSLTVTPTNRVIGVTSNLQFTATGTFSDGSSSTLISSGNTWTNGAAIPTASYGLGGAFVNGKFYAISGFATARLGIYDPTLNTWTTGTPLPADTGFNLRQYAGTAVLDGKVYVVGGDTGSSGDRATLLRYDPALNTWTTLAPMPLGARYALGAAALNGKIYAVGGTTVAGATALARVEEYDPSANTWATKASMPTAHLGALVGAIGGKLYVAGGSDASGPTTATHAYDPALNTWSTNAPMPFAGNGDGVVLNGKLFSIGAGPSPERRVFAYDAALNSWSTNFALMPTGRRQMAVAADEVSGRIFAASGYNSTYSSALEIFTPPALTWSSSASVVASINTNGLATGLSVGSSTITASAGNMAANTILSVVAQPTISMQPTNATAAANGSVTLSVGASGGGLTYQWLLNGTNIAGATGATLTLTNLNASQAGVYSVIVSNAAGMVTSSSATLSLLSLQMYAGLTIVGPVGGNYQIDYRNDLNNTNWFNLTNIVLPSSPYLFIDAASPQSPRRFYRAVLVP